MIKLWFDKFAFFKTLGYRPHPGQFEIHASEAARRIVACGARWGKTRCAAMEGIAAAMLPCDRSVGWVVAPTYELTDRVFQEIVRIVRRHLGHHIKELRERERVLVLYNMAGGLSEIRGKSADSEVSLLGEGLDWVIVDEASRLKPSIWQSYLSQRLVDKKGWALLIATPHGKGWFYDMYRRGQGPDPDYQSWNQPSWNNPLLDPEEIEKQREAIPERVFREQYGAEFIEGSGSVFRYVRDCATGTLEDPISGQRYYAGLDLAKVEDFTVLVILNKAWEVVFVDRFHRLDWSLQMARVKAATDRYGRARVLVDSTGVGEPIYEALRAAGCRAKPYRFTQQSKAALINHLALLLEQRKITLPRPELWPEGIDELEAFQYSVTDADNVRTGAPSGYHDDCVIALALAAWQRKRRRPRPGILSVRSPF